MTGWLADLTAIDYTRDIPHSYRHALAIVSKALRSELDMQFSPLTLTLALALIRCRCRRRRTS